MSKRVHRQQFLLWGIDDRDAWAWGTRKWGRWSLRVGLHRSVHLGPLEIRLWAMKPADWERLKRTWRTW